MVMLGRPSKATKVSGPWSKNHSMRSSSLDAQADETETAAFPAFAQDEQLPAHHLTTSTSTPSPPPNNSTSRSSPLKHSWQDHRPSSSSKSKTSSKKGMTIPDFYATSTRGSDKLLPKPKVHVIPHRRRSSNRESTSLDLSISATENEGLGIYTSYDRERRNADNSQFAQVASRTAAASHGRSSSGTSQYSGSAMPNSSRPGAQYVHPMRQTPRPYTPPMSNSNKTSIIGSELSDGQNSAPATDGQVTSGGGREQHKYYSSSVGSHSHTDPRQSFQLTSDSYSRLPTASQTNAAGTASTHSRAFDTNSLLETTSPVSRNSLDFAFRTKSRTSTSNDPMARAAAVQAARQAFEDREAAKVRKLEKANDREAKRKARKEPELLQRPRSSEEQPASTGRPSLADFSFREPRTSHPEKTSRSEDSSRQNRFTHDSSEKEKGAHKAKSPKSAWLLFLTWLRTRIFKMGRKFKK